jgi:ribosomal protein L7/L12
MAVKFNSDAQVVFFEVLFGKSNVVVELCKALVAKGIKFEVPFCAIKAHYQGKFYQLPLPKSSTAFMNGAVDPSVAEAAKDSIVGWLNKLAVLTSVMIPNVTMPQAVSPEATAPLVAEVTPFPEGTMYSLFVTGVKSGCDKILLIKTIRQYTSLSLYEAKMYVDIAEKGKIDITIAQPIAESVNLSTILKIKATIESATGVVTLVAGGVDVTATVKAPDAHQEAAQVLYPTPTVKSAPVAEVIPLKDAKALGQKVKGTSAGSVYHCIAVGKHIRIAARVQQDSLSLRAEWSGATQAELKKLQGVGLQMHKEYASMHFALNSVPLGRVIGGILMDLGLEFDQQVSSINQMVVE